MGYTSVEAASYKDGLLYGTPPQQFRRDVEEAGMKVLSTHWHAQPLGSRTGDGRFLRGARVVGRMYRGA